MFYLDLFSALHRHRVDYVLIGGLAVALHGIERNTMDIFPPVDPASMCQRALQLDVSGVPVKLASIDDLIALKQSVARPIDLADIEHLKRLQNP